MLQDAHLTDIGAQRQQSTPPDAADAEMGQSALDTLTRQHHPQRLQLLDYLWFIAVRL
jgi:hypothetical protein